MKILLDNVNLGSTSGPNSFGRQLTNELLKRNHIVHNVIDIVKQRIAHIERPDVHLAFIESNITIDSPLIQRLDGIYYNSDSQYGDWWLQNSRINETYDRSAGVIFQSPFSKTLVESFFGEKHTDDAVIINNGVDMSVIASVPEMNDETLDNFDKVWVSASNWRPHKRLSENVRYFLEHSGDNDVLIIAGAQGGPGSDHERILYVGELTWHALIALYKRADNFIHLAYHDNCPNVIVDARAAGCNIICAGCAGSQFVAGPEAIVIDEDDWVPQPIELYKPPKLDFRRARRCGVESSIDIVDVVDRYIEFLMRYVK